MRHINHFNEPFEFVGYPESPIKVKKLITISAKLFKALRIKANKFGMTYGEYLRSLIAKDVTQELEQIDRFLTSQGQNQP